MAEAGNGIRPLNDDHVIAAGRMYMDFDGMPDDFPCDEDTNYISRKEDMDYGDLCTLESLLSYFKHDESLDMEIANLKEKCLMDEINRLRKTISIHEEVRSQLESERYNWMCNGNDELLERYADVLTLMFYVKSERVPADKVNELIKKAISNPMSLVEYIDEADKSKYDVNMTKYVEDVEGEW